MPWWLAGISHHMSGYSAAVFVAYAAVAYSYGITIYIWAFVPLALSTAVGAFVFAPRWNRLRIKYDVASPLEYLKNRYDLRTQQALAWSGMLLKIVDVGAKWAAIATLLSVFTGVSLNQGILITGADMSSSVRISPVSRYRVAPREKGVSSMTRSSGVTACRTLSASSTTSGPMPSPRITASLSVRTSIRA